MSSLLKKRYFLPVAASVAAFVLFRLALHNPLDARTFSSLEIPSIVTANEFDGVYTQLVARILNSIFYDAELSFRILTALATGFSVYFLQKLFPENARWSIGYVVANISFLYFAMHSPTAMMIVLVFSAFLASWEKTGPTQLATAGLLAAVMLGFDSLLAIALILYSFTRIMASGDRAKTKLPALAATLLGIAGWVLLAYTIYASRGFTAAIGFGFEHIFERVNPINFGVGLIVTFNLLLIWVFRTPSDKVSPRYLGSVLIVLFLFVRAEPIHLVLLLIAGVSYLHKLNALPKHKWVQPAYALLNIGAFFLLPAVAPLEAAYNVRAARSSEAELYYTSYFARHLPAYQALATKEAIVVASRELLSDSSASPVILDPALEVSYRMSALRAAGSRRFIGGFQVDRRRFQSVFGVDTSMLEPSKGTSCINYLASVSQPRELDTLLRALNTPHLDREGLKYYTIDSATYSQFFDAYIYYHYLSFH